ncbi:ankyrin repeat-containing domain protein [Mycena alexandri]|uniref:Ankyrin repeat-containing domain protein n=1 Tax=Mycena alexandri TaxID=1745969 RepID=A0AAD6SLQ2_9AGAR|nr:ankyrin repeat-containing domain protein [Mycena alexandri]
MPSHASLDFESITKSGSNLVQDRLEATLSICSLGLFPHVSILATRPLGSPAVSFHNKSSKTVDQAKGGAGPKAAVMAASESVEELPLKLIIDANAGAPSVVSRGGYKRIIKIFTQHGVVPNASALMAAARGGHQSIVQALLAHGVDAYEDAQAAAESGHESIIKLLIDRGADMNTGATRALVAASKGGRESIINLLIDRGADMKTGATRALVAASKGGHESIVQLLIDHGADVNAGGRRALVAASEGGHESVVRLLIHYGADVNAGLWAASAGGHESIVQLLVDRGAGLNAGALMAASAGGARERCAPRALVAASQVGHESIVRLLIDHGADVNADAAYALVAASKGGHESIVQLLIDRGADVNADAVHAPRALVAASKGGHESIVQLLIDRGADVNADAVHAPRALVAASKGGHESIVQLLIDHGADVNAGGPCALAAASADGHKSIVQLLIDHGADVNAGGPRALAAASAGGHKSIVQLLIDHGADVNADAAYALEAASRSGHESIVQLLIDHGADVNATATHALVAASEGAYESIGIKLQTPPVFSPEDIQRLKSEYADGGSATVVYRPEPAVLWLQMHHDHPLIEAIQSRNVGGPIAAMLAPDSPCLVIFGSIHDGWVLKAAKLLADESQFTVMVRPLRDNPLFTWEGTDTPSGAVPLDHDILQIEENNETDEGEDLDTESEGNSDSTDNDDSDTTGLSGAFHLRGGAVADYEPWLGPVHDVDVRLDVYPTISSLYQVDLLTKIQFKTQAEYESKKRDGYRPQIVVWVSFSMPPRATKSTKKTVDTEARANSTTFGLAAGASIPGHGTVAAKVNHTSSKIDTKAVENQNDKVTPKCTIHYQPGRRSKIAETACESYEIAYEAAEDLNRKGSKYPLEVEFSVGIHVVDRDLINDRTSTVPEIPDLPETSFLIMNQINLWINSDHKAERQGILVLTVAHIPDIHTDDRVAILESQEVKLAKGSFIPVPTDTQPALYQGKMSVSAVVQPQRAEPKQPGRMKKFFNNVAVKSFLRRKTVPRNPTIETLFMHELISRGWDLRLNQWREQTYPSLTSSFHRLRPESSDVVVWQVAVEDRAPKTKGKEREQAPNTPDVHVPPSKPDQGGGAFLDASSTTGSQQTSGNADTATSATSLSTHAAATGGSSINADNQVAEKVAGPSSSEHTS